MAVDDRALIVRDEPAEVHPVDGRATTVEDTSLSAGVR